MSKNRIQALSEIALFATMAYVLDVFTQPMQFGPWISFSFKMLPIFIVCFRWGTKAGVLSGLLWGLLQVITGEASKGFLNLFQGFLEYFVAFSLIGMAGLIKPLVDKSFKERKKIQTLVYIILGILIGTSSRYLIHFFAGVIFWGSYAPEGSNIILYSFTINGISGLGEALTCTLLIWLLYPLMRFFLTQSRDT